MIEAGFRQRKWIMNESFLSSGAYTDVQSLRDQAERRSQEVGAQAGIPGHRVYAIEAVRFLVALLPSSPVFVSVPHPQLHCFQYHRHQT